MAKTDAPPAKGDGVRSIIFERKGPLPVWAWALLGLGAVLVFTWWRQSRTANASANAGASGVTQNLPGDQTAPPVFIVPPATPPAVNVEPPSVTVPITVTPPGTVPEAPPGGGAPPPSNPPPGAPPPASNTINTGDTVIVTGRGWSNSGGPTTPGNQTKLWPSGQRMAVVKTNANAYGYALNQYGDPNGGVTGWWPRSALQKV